MSSYGEFLKANEVILKSLPAPNVAASYYTGEDLYAFDDFQVSFIL